MKSILFDVTVSKFVLGSATQSPLGFSYQLFLIISQSPKLLINMEPTDPINTTV